MILEDVGVGECTVAFQPHQHADTECRALGQRPGAARLALGARAPALQRPAPGRGVARPNNRRSGAKVAEDTAKLRPTCCRAISKEELS